MANVCESQCSPADSSPLILPVEIWMQVLSHLTVKDILSLCATCGPLKSLLAHKTVWALILRCVCQQDGVFFPSYDLEKMDIEQIQRAAMGKHRWGQTLERGCLQPDEEALNDPSILQPALGPITFASMATSPEHGSAFHCLKIVLIPGGRYLLVADMYRVRVLDLGIPGTKPLSSPIELANMTFERLDDPVHKVHLLAWEYAAGKLGVVMGIEPRNGRFVSVKVVSFIPSESRPEFKVVRTVVVTTVLPNSRWEIQVHKSRLFIHAVKSSLGVVWNFETGRYTSFCRQSHQGHIDFEVFTGEFVARFTYDSIFLSSVPPLINEMASNNQIQLQDHPEIEEARYVYPFRSDPPHPYLHRVSVSCPQMSFPIILDVYPPTFPLNNLKPSRFLVDVAPNHFGEPTPWNMTFTLQTTFTLPPHLISNELGSLNDQTPLDTGYASRTLVMLAIPNSNRYRWGLSLLSVMTPPDANSSKSCAVQRRTTGENAALTILSVYDPSSESDGIVACDLCSTSGRLVYMTKEKGDVFLVDYLPE